MTALSADPLWKLSMRIAAIQPDRMGDVMFSWPVLAKLRDRFSSEITLFIHEDAAPLLGLVRACPVLDKCEVLPRGADWFNDPLRNLRRLSLFSKFDMIFNFTHLPRWSSSSATDFRDRDLHMIDFNAYQAGEVLGEELHLVDDERILPLEVLPDKKLEGDYIVLACWSKDGRRCWDFGLWDKLISILKFPAYAIGGPKEKCPRGAFSLLGQTNTYEYAQIVQGAKLFVSVETFCTSMLAEALGTPIVKIHNSWDHVFNLHPFTVGPGNPSWPGWRFTTAARGEAFSKLKDVAEAASDLLTNYDRERGLARNRYLECAA